MRHTSIAVAARALRSGEITSEQLLVEANAAADAHDECLGTYLARFDEQALAASRLLDAELRAGHDRGPLHGIPFAIKDVITTAEGPTTAQSLVFDPGWTPRVDAPAVARLRAAGAVITGKTGTSEFATGVPDPEKPFPIARNPWDLRRFTGGSSTGNASGISAGLFLGALGTDTAGSIRQPAALCGISGLKPTFGRVPKSGCVPLGYSYDHVGPMARSAWDCAVILTAIAGRDPDDPSSSGRPVSDYAATLDGNLRGMRIGVDLLSAHWTTAADGLEVALEKAIAILSEAGATIVPIRLPHYREISDAALFGYTVEAFGDHRTGLRHRWSDYSRATRLSLASGALTSAGDYVQMQRVRRLGQHEVGVVFAAVDLVLTPTASTAAPLLDGLDISTIAAAVQTPYWNAVGNPALSVPIGFTLDGLPLGMQLAGRPFDEVAVLAAGHAYQLRTDWHLRVPPVTPIGRGTDGTFPCRDRGLGRTTAESSPSPISSADEILTCRLLDAAGIVPDDAEIVQLARSFHGRRIRLDALYAIRETYHLPPIGVFRADPEDRWL
ncbi:MAG: amidase [Microbacteriaceae bacterium]|nr:MAG: amidase [Microbacteriaceae bacterium]